MKVITLASRKGGTGKTTLAINLAAIANRSERACVVDMDPQQSTQVWKRLRAQDETLPKLSTGSCRPAGLPQLLRELQSRNMRWIFIDTPPSLKRQLTHRNAIANALNVGHALSDRQSYEAAYLEFERLWRQIRSLIRREQ